MIINITDKYTHTAQDIFAAIGTVIDEIYLDDTPAVVAILVDTDKYNIKVVTDYLLSRHVLSSIARPHNYYQDNLSVGNTQIHVVRKEHYYRTIGMSLSYAIVPNNNFIKTADYSLYDVVKSRTTLLHPNKTIKHIIGYI